MELIIYGTLGYMIVTFPYALVWHMGLFRKKYEAWNYFGKHPSPPIGLFSMIFQGAVLSYFYGQLNIDHSSMAAGIEYALIMGIFFWSCHVVAAAAKHHELRNPSFLIMESIYLAGQFALYGVVITMIHGWL